MPRKIVEVTQTAVDTTTELAFSTFLSAEGKAGWRINSARFYWPNMELVTTEGNMTAALNTETGTTDFGDESHLLLGSWNFEVAGTAGNMLLVPLKMDDFTIGERITVQPELFLRCTSSSTGVANKIVMHLDYDVVKLSDIDVLRLLAGGA